MISHSIMFKARITGTQEFLESTAINRQIDMRGNEHTFMGIPEKSKFAPLQETLSWKEVDSHTVGRFTGQEDMNGTRIYENDVIKQPDDSVYLIFWSDNYLQFRAKRLNNGDEHFKNFCDFAPSQVIVVGTKFGYTLTFEAED